MPFNFLRQYISTPRITGAIAPSSKYLAAKMIENINFLKAKYIVEYGPGTGVFTTELIAKRKPGTQLLLIERNEKFYKMLTEKFKDVPDIKIINDTAEHVGDILKKNGIPLADYIVSGLPFASLPGGAAHEIMLQTQRCLRNGGKFITFQYTRMKFDFFRTYFKRFDVTHEWRNVPPAYVLTCINEK